MIGTGWGGEAEALLPGSVGQMESDALTFFDVDLAALLSWQFTAEEAAQISCPVLYVGGTDSGAWFAEVRKLMLEWLPHANDVVIDGADHSLALTHPRQLSEAIANFIADHPMPQRST